MPLNQPQRVADIIAQLESLAGVKPKTPEEAQGLAQAQQQLMNRMQSMSESSLRMPGEGLEGFDFSGDITGKVINAPWNKGGMPGNFERRQRMANSLAEDAALNAGRSHSYSWKGGDPVVAQFSRKSIPWMANASSMMQDNDEVYLSGPPDMDRMLLHRQNAGMWDPSGERAFTKSEVERLQKMLKRGGSGMRGMIERRYGDRPFYNEIFGG